MAAEDGFSVEAAVRVLIARVDRMERVLCQVRAAMPVASLVEPAPVEALAVPTDRQRLEMVGVALQELEGGKDEQADK